MACREDSRAADREFDWPVIDEPFNWAHDWFDVFATNSPRPGLIIVEESGERAVFTFAEMAARSNRVARWLSGLGLGKGDAVLISLGNQVALWDMMLAVMKLGGIIVPTSTVVGSDELAERVERTGAKAVVCNGSESEKFDAVQGVFLRLAVGPVEQSTLDWHDLADADTSDSAPLEHPGTLAKDPLLLYFTSGTTSRPKLVEHTQTSYPVGHMSTMYWLGLMPGDVHLNISSPGWAKHAWSCFFAPWIAEATILIFNYARFDAASLLGVLRTNEVTSFCAPPTVWRMIINADLSGGRAQLREACSAGEPLNPEVIEQVQNKWGLTIRDGFGQTETTAQVGNSPGLPIKPGSVGRALPGVPVVLVEPVSGERVIGVGEGEICLDLSQHPVNLMTGYKGDPERDTEAMAGGYHHTGDVASVDADGYITYVGRTDDVFKASDYKISPFELESVLIEHPAVAEAAVVPAPDEVRLAVPKAYVALAPGHEPDEATALDILKHARGRLAPYQRVRRLEFFDLPKTISGKIRRVELRTREESFASSQIETEWRDDKLRG